MNSSLNLKSHANSHYQRSKYISNKQNKNKRRRVLLEKKIQRRVDKIPHHTKNPSFAGV
jgi:hypothetical protein